MSDVDYGDLPARAHSGERDAIDQLIELAGEAGDVELLRTLADAGHSDAVDVLVELATERHDLRELRRLADKGSRDAADQLLEFEEGDDSASEE